MAMSGLATVLFTDLVGSTRMRERLGDNAADEIGVEHVRIIGDALSSKPLLDAVAATRRTATG